MADHRIVAHPGYLPAPFLPVEQQAGLVSHPRQFPGRIVRYPVGQRVKVAFVGAVAPEAAALAQRGGLDDGLAPAGPTDGRQWR